MSGILEPQYRKDYLLGGNATATFVSKKSGDRFTYKIRRSDDGKVYFVSILTGPDNVHDFEYLGTIRADSGKFFHGAKSKIQKTAPSAVAFAWTLEHLDDELADRVEVWHEGACSRCGRPLTDPESIQRGLGPVCAERAMGL